MSVSNAGAVKGMDVLRYILIAPTAIAAWLFAAAISLQVEYYRAVLFCPAEFREGADCYATDWVMWPLWLITSGAVLSAVLVIVSVAIVAPRGKLRISVYVYVVGVFMATLLAFSTGYFVPYIAAVVMGGGAVVAVGRITKVSIATAFPRLSRSIAEH
ncbi:MAG: hypothetical protein MI754_16595 [Chromatiales bacterium]|nr:hypothetical protein [Chromatiales bacterium]